MREKTGSDEKKSPKTTSLPTWFGFARREIIPGESVRIQIQWKRVVVFLCVLGILGWMGKSWGLYLFFKNVRQFEDVSFVDMILYPANRDSVRIQQGDYQIAQAKNALEREDYRRAFALLREGVARSIENLEGRMLLGQIYASWRPELAMDLLVEGIDQGKSDPDYVRLLSSLLLNAKEDQKLLDLTGDLLEEDLNANVRQILLASRLQAAIFLGKFDIAREVFEDSNLEQSLDGLLLGTRMYAATGRTQDAIDVLQSALNALPDERKGAVYAQLISLYKSEARHQEAREAILDLMLLQPLEWQPRLLLVDMLSASGMTERRDREIAALLREFREEEQAMIGLAQLSADYGNIEAASRLYEIALENGYSLSVFSLTLAESMVMAGEYQKAVDLCNELVREDPSWIVSSEGGFNAIRSLAYFGAGDTELGSLYLKNFVNSKQTNANQLFQAAKRYQGMGLLEQAKLILEEAHLRDENHQEILATLIEVEMDLGIFFSLKDNLEKLFTLRRPEYEVIARIRNRLQSDRFLYTANREQLLGELSSIIDEQLQMRWDIWQKQEARTTG